MLRLFLLHGSRGLRENSLAYHANHIKYQHLVAMIEYRARKIITGPCSVNDILASVKWPCLDQSDFVFYDYQGYVGLTKTQDIVFA